MHSSITFVLLGNGRAPIGGYKIIYEYANRLAARGWHVNVIHPAILKQPKQSLIDSLKFLIVYYRRLVSKWYLPSSWFQIDKRVRMMWVLTLNEKFIPNADYIVACPVESASFVNSYSAKKGKKYYFLQHFEDWAMKKEEVEKTWKFPMKKIVISQWLKDLAAQLGEEAIYIPNGLDFSFFKNIVPFSNRPLQSVIFLSHTLEIKGTKYVIEAIRILRKKHPEMVIKSFGVYPIPDGFPEFIEYFLKPSQTTLRDLYNSSAIFISPSLSEGWPLPPAEAMMCGCAVVATDIGGHREYITDGVNGFLCKPASAESIIEKVEFIFHNPDKAQKASELAPQTLKKFDWDSRVDLFEQALVSPDPIVRE
jgi:glycosyltransferase involved in cell wall biosynthesis